MTNEKTKDLLDGRSATYGNRIINMESAAEMVNSYLAGVEQREGKRIIDGADFAMIMVLYKIYRFAVAPNYGDNIDDIEGYTAIARELLGDNLVAAKSAEEYQKSLVSEHDKGKNHPAYKAKHLAPAQGTTYTRYPRNLDVAEFLPGFRDPCLPEPSEGSRDGGNGPKAPYQAKHSAAWALRQDLLKADRGPDYSLED